MEMKPSLWEREVEYIHSHDKQNSHHIEWPLHVAGSQVKRREHLKETEKETVKNVFAKKINYGHLENDVRIFRMNAGACGDDK